MALKEEKELSNLNPVIAKLNYKLHSHTARKRSVLSDVAPSVAHALKAREVEIAATPLLRSPADVVRFPTKRRLC